MEAVVLSCCEKKFKDKETGKERCYYMLYMADSTGAVGSVYSTEAKKAGEKVSLRLAVGRDGKFTVRLSA